ncbi:chitinase [Plasmodium reichenowi]|uniref:Chitinase n=1 Tax=Plasmodium reichenowi TaxID=5854 RepID=A0A2P9DIW3_PLARE|nr:chitinase [Plasmodium reichenowi]
MNFTVKYSFLVICLLCCLLSTYVSVIEGHRARPGESRKNPREIIKTFKDSGKGIIQGYYPSWVSYNHNLKDLNANLNVVHMSFAKMDLSYESIESIVGSPSLFKSLIGLEYIGLNEYFNDAMNLRKARPDIIMLLSLGGETYHPSSFDSALNAVEKIANLVDELGFDGIDVDYEPNGSFDGLNEKEKADFFVQYVTKLREYMCDDKLISISQSSNGALSCIGFNDPKKICMDDEAPYNSKYFNKPDVKKELLRAAQMASAGGAIYLMNNLKDMIDMVFVQTFNYTNSTDSTVMKELYDSYAYYGKKYDYVIIMGFTLMFPSTPFNPNDKMFVKSIGDFVKTENKLNKRADGFGLWSLSSDNAAHNEQLAIENFVESLH